MIALWEGIKLGIELVSIGFCIGLGMGIAWLIIFNNKVIIARISKGESN